MVNKQTLRNRRKKGNNANHSTANANNPNTLLLDGNLEASNTDAKIAKFIDKESGYLLLYYL